MKLFTYWRSQASYRVRIALHLKGLQAELTFLDLLKGDQHAQDYRALNPERVVPTLIDGAGPPLVQSLAIVEYLDERYPQPALLPVDARDRAHVRALAQVVAMDSHPLLAPRVRKYLEQELGVDESARNGWLRHWLDMGTAALEELLARDRRTGRFCLGDTPTLADICLAAHVATTEMFFRESLERYPTVRRIAAECMQLDAFAQTHPLRQPDAPVAAT